MYALCEPVMLTEFGCYQEMPALMVPCSIGESKADFGADESGRGVRNAHLFRLYDRPGKERCRYLSPDAGSGAVCLRA